MHVQVLLFFDILSYSSCYLKTIDNNIYNNNNIYSHIAKDFLAPQTLFHI